MIDKKLQVVTKLDIELKILLITQVFDLLIRLRIFDMLTSSVADPGSGTPPFDPWTRIRDPEYVFSGSRIPKSSF
jgi:hypothetical protein